MILKLEMLMLVIEVDFEFVIFEYELISWG